MTEYRKRTGRPSKGPRHTFTIKLDMERAVKLVELLEMRETSGVEYLTPIIAAHVDSIDLDQFRAGAEGSRRAEAESAATSPARSAVRPRPTQEERLRRAQVLARKVDLLLDARATESGRQYDYEAIAAGAEKIGYSLSRTRWSLLKAGKEQVVPDACLRAIATVFGVDPEYLLHDEAALPAEVEAMLPQVRLKRLSDVRDFAVKTLGGAIDPQRLEAITKFIDQALESLPPAQEGAELGQHETEER